MTGSGNNTYLLIDEGSSAILVDAGIGDPRHLEELRHALASTDSRLDQVLVTHGHADHAGGAAAIAADHPDALFAKHPWPGQDEQFAVQWRAIADGDSLGTGS